MNLSIMALLFHYQTKGKFSNAASTRSIILLNTIRKIPTVIILDRIRPYIEDCFPKTQALYMPIRSTTDIFRALKISIDRALNFKSNLDIRGIDVSSAFDIINRKNFLKYLKKLYLFVK